MEIEFLLYDQCEVEQSGSLKGYRAIRKIIRDKHHIIVRRYKYNLFKYYMYFNHYNRNTVMRILRDVDSEGVEFRSRKRLKRQRYVNRV